MAADCRAEVHVGDVGTKYRTEVLDNCEPFDPSTADTLQLIFLLPGGGVLVKDATLETEGSPADRWFLTYTVVADDGIGSPPGDFHAQTGPLKVQFYVEWADGRHFHSNIRAVDIDNRELRVYANLN
jgi:hypothetical protein